MPDMDPTTTSPSTEGEGTTTGDQSTKKPPEATKPTPDPSGTTTQTDSTETTTEPTSPTQGGEGTDDLFKTKEAATEAYLALNKTHEQKLTTLKTALAQAEAARDAAVAEKNDFVAQFSTSQDQVTELTETAETLEKEKAAESAEAAYYRLLATEFGHVAPIIEELRESGMGPAVDADEDALRTAFTKVADTMGEAADRKAFSDAQGATQPKPGQVPSGDGAKSVAELQRLISEASKAKRRGSAEDRQKAAEDYQKYSKMLADSYEGPVTSGVPQSSEFGV